MSALLKLIPDRRDPRDPRVADEDDAAHEQAIAQCLAEVAEAAGVSATAIVAPRSAPTAEARRRARLARILVVLRLHRHHGVPMRRVAEVLGITRVAAYALCNRGEASLRVSAWALQQLERPAGK